MTDAHLYLIEQLELARLSAGETDALIREKTGKTCLEALTYDECMAMAKELIARWRKRMLALRERKRIERKKCRRKVPKRETCASA